MTENTTSKNKVAIYIRVSTVHQIDRDSIPMQRADLISYAKLILNTDNYVVFEDAGYSGKNTDRPNFQKMMNQIRTGIFTHLLVWKIDRISRNLLDFSQMYSELKKLGVTFVSKNEQFDTSTAVGEAMLKIILIFAELERNMTSERVTATMISRASNGQWNGGRIPFGYNYDSKTKEFTINETEAELVRHIHNEYEKCHSIVRETRLLNENGFRTRSGHLWNPVSIYIILQSIFYCGDYRYNVLKEGNRQKAKDKSEWVTTENHHAAIISREQKNRIISFLTANNRLRKRYKKATKHVHVFSGLLVCANCGKIMNSTPASAKKDWQYSKYSCPSIRMNPTCNAKSISDPIIGEFTFNYILNLLNTQKAFPFIKTPADLQKSLLVGNTFSNIDHIEEQGLYDLFNILSTTKLKKSIFGKSKIAKSSVSKITYLKSKRAKLTEALDRLTNLFLYSEKAMPQEEFISRKSKLTEEIDEIDEQINFSNSEAPKLSIDDEELIKKASEFILTQKLTNRCYISYKNLAITVDATILKSFVQEIIDSIIIDSGKIKQIVFRNGLTHTFIYK